MSDDSSDGCGCTGCLSLIILVFVLWAFWFGLKTPWGTYNLDMFPPQIRKIEQ